MVNLEQRWIRKDRPADFNEFWGSVMVKWVDHMFKYAKITPPDIDYIELYKKISHFVIPQVRSANEGVQETLNILWECGYNVYTASGEVSWELKDYIWGMGCEGFFHNLYYGPDLINEGKLSPLFFKKIFQDVGILPSQAVLVDDNPHFLEFAKEAGAHIVQSHINSSKRKVAEYVVHNFREIPYVIEKITNS